MKNLIFALKAMDRGGFALYLVGSVIICAGVVSDETWWLKFLRIALLVVVFNQFIRVEPHAYQALSLGYQRWRRDLAAVLMCGAVTAMVLCFPILLWFGENLLYLAIPPVSAAFYFIRVTRSRYESGSKRLWTKERKEKRLDVRTGQQWRDSALETSFMAKPWVGGAIMAAGALALATVDSVLCAWQGGLPGERLSDGVLISIFFVFTMFYGGAGATDMRQTHRLWVQLGGDRKLWVKHQGAWMLSLILGSLVGAGFLWGYSLASVTSVEGEEASRGIALIFVAIAFATIVFTWVNFLTTTVVGRFASVFIVAIACIVSTGFAQNLGFGLPSLGIVFAWMFIAGVIVVMTRWAVNRIDPFAEIPIAGWLGLQKSTSTPA